MVSILRAGGLGSGGFTSMRSCGGPPSSGGPLYAHIGGFDAYALAFKIARRILAEGRFTEFVAARYNSYNVGFGRDIEAGKVGFADLEKIVLQLGEPVPHSGHQEYLENLLNQYLHG